jgi:hypothetical protein
MNGVELGKELPESFLREATEIGFEAGEFKGSLRPPRHGKNEETQTETERVVRHIKEKVLPKVKGKPSNPP